MLEKKRGSDHVKDWFEYWFDYDSYKFRRLSSWAPDVHVADEAMEE